MDETSHTFVQHPEIIPQKGKYRVEAISSGGGKCQDRFNASLLCRVL
jgi:hypothetical protein